MSLADLALPLDNAANVVGRISLDAVWIGLLAVALAYARLWTPRWRLVIVGLALLRLALPVLPENPFHPGRLLPRSNAAAAGEARTVAAVPQVAMQVTDMVAPAAASISTAQPVHWLGAVWLAGFAVCLLWLAGSHGLLMRRLRRGVVVEDERLAALLSRAAQAVGARRSPRLIALPHWNLVALVGWVRPRLVITPEFAGQFSDAEILTIFKHELAHLKRRDIAWNVVWFIICAAHWFNPLAWFLFRSWRNEVELRCDEIALRGTSEEQRLGYGRALLAMLATLTPSAPVTAAPLFHRKLNLKHRMHMITHPRPVSRLAQGLAAAVVAVLAVTSLSTARADGEREREKPVKRGPAQVEQAILAVTTHGYQPGDTLQLTIAEDPTYNGTYQVKAGGYIILPKLGKVTVVGKDSAAVQLTIKDTLELKHAKAVTVTVRDGVVGVAAREVEAPARGAREGDGGVRVGPRDGEGVRNGPRDGEGMRRGPRDGEAPARVGPRDGEGGLRAGPRDGEGVRVGPKDGEGVRAGPRDGEGVRAGPRDGEGDVRRGPRDGEGVRVGPREGDGQMRVGPREGDGARRVGPREGDPGVQRGGREGEGQMRAGPREGAGNVRRGEGEGMAAAEGRHITIPVNASGQVLGGDGAPLSRPELRAELKRIAASANGRPIYVQADQGISTAMLQSLVKECQAARIRNLYLGVPRQ